MAWQWVIPIIDRDLAAGCLQSLAVDPATVLVVDNCAAPFNGPPGMRVHRAGQNLGVSASWNLGAKIVIEEGLDGLILCSQAVMFTAGGLDLIAALDAGAADDTGFETAGHGWHLIGFTRRALRTVGPFDEGFWPGYFEDTDYLYRMGLLDLPSPRENGRAMPTIAVATQDRGQALSYHYGHVRPHWSALEARYVEKWGGRQGSETFRSPFNSGQPTWWWPTSPYSVTDPWRREG